MPQNLSIIQTKQKHLVATADPWLALLQVDMPNGGPTYYFARNAEDVIYNGHTYVAFGFGVDPIYDKSTGELQTVTVWVSNVTRLLAADLETYDGGTDAVVTLRVVTKADMAAAPAVELNFDVTATNATRDRVTFILGADNPLRKMFPRYVYMADYCMWVFNSPALRALGNPRGLGLQCAYAGAATVCTHKLEGADGCRAKANQQRYGGFPGIDAAGFRLATSV